MSMWHDEKAKLTAAFVNNIAVAVIVAGCVAPLFSILYGLGNLTPDQVRLIEIAAPTWLVIGVIIHSLGRVILNGVGGQK